MKVEIKKLGGVHALANLLSSHDPDVKMSALTGLSALFDDCTNRSEFRKIEAFPKLIALVSSEYLELKMNALHCLNKCAKDGKFFLFHQQ
jgi:hypothetical protein